MSRHLLSPQLTRFRLVMQAGRKIPTVGATEAEFTLCQHHPCAYACAVVAQALDRTRRNPPPLTNKTFTILGGEKFVQILPSGHEVVLLRRTHLARRERR